MSISISRAILHILDTTVGVPVISEKLMVLTEEMREYTEKQIVKCYNDPDLKKTKFIVEEGLFYETIKNYKADREFMKAANVFNYSN